jgi:GMP reductase
MKIEDEIKLDFNDVLIRPKRTTLNTRSDVDLCRTMKFKYSSYTWNGIPIIAANMDTVGTFEVYNVLKKHKIITATHKFYTIQDFKNADKIYGLDENYFMISTGMGEGAIERLKEIFNEIKCKWICIDIANGYIQNFVKFCRKVREQFPDKIIVAGNVVSREMTEELILNGMVDIVKVGIGPGSACTTRMKTGVGMPQLSAIIECSDAAHGVDGHIISDGGITCPGDVSKAFGAGGDFVMIGGQFAGHDENPGEIITENGEKYKLFYGMSSDTAMNTYYGKVASYRSSEGRTVKLKYKGELDNTVLDYLGGIRSTCTYINAKNLKNIPKCCTFVRVNRQLNTIYA